MDVSLLYSMSLGLVVCLMLNDKDQPMIFKHEWDQKVISCFWTLFSQPWDSIITQRIAETMVNYSILMHK